MRHIALTFLASLMAIAPVMAERRSQSALTLLEPAGARAAAVGEAFSGATDDITAFSYNPASLSTLKSGHASFLYKQGLIDDAYGNFSIGVPRVHGGLALSVGTYDAGTAQVSDGTAVRTVAVQKDLLVSVGGSRQIGRVSIGASGKYFSSDLGEKVKADTLAMDIGLSAALGPRLQAGIALQNTGGSLTYASKEEDLPRIARVGASWRAVEGKMPGTVFIDLPYYMTTSETRPAVGYETNLGPLSLRAGWRALRGAQDFSIGTGFQWGRAALDYAFGLVQNVDSRHQVSLATRFGGVPKPAPFVKKPEQKPIVMQDVVTYTATPMPTFGTTAAPAAGIYIVQAGDTLKNIAKRKYGYEAFWDDIYRANAHVLTDPEKLVPGQKILLPRKAN